MGDDITADDADKVADAVDRIDETSSSEEPVQTEAEATDNGAEAPSVEATKVNSPTKSGDRSGISTAQFVQLEELAAAADIPPANLEKMHDLKVNVQAILGRSKMSVESVLKLHQGGIVELDKLAGEPLEITANGRAIARGEVVVIDGSFGVKIIDIVGMRQKLSVAGG